MKRTVLLTVLAFGLTLGALPAAASSPEPAPLHRAGGEAVEGRYIVVMKGDHPAAQAAERAGVRPQHVYEHALNGFSARMNERQLEAVRRNPRVDFVEEDQVATTLGEPRRDPRPESGDVGTSNHNVQTNPPWGLDRIDQRSLPLDNRYRYHTTASNVDVYIVDTGIETSHPDFGRRALVGYDAFGGDGQDCNGHGTHVAGTAGGTTHGVAKGTYLWSVRVLDCNGSGSYSGIIAGTDWVRQHAASWPGYPAVANYSLGGGYSSALNNAVNNLSNSGVFVAVAAGSDACNTSPASASTTFVTDWSDRADQTGPGGPCVDVYAPGVSITSAWLGGGTNTLSGSSTASPHSAGVGALYKAYGDAHYSTVRDWITDNATPLPLAPRPSLLLYKADL